MVRNFEQVEHEVALARAFGRGAQAVSEFEFGLEEVGLQPRHSFRVEAVLTKASAAGPSECDVGSELRSIASWYCCLTVGSDKLSPRCSSIRPSGHTSCVRAVA